MHEHQPLLRLCVLSPAADMQKLVTLWPGLAHILTRAEAPMEDLRTELAACCLLAMRHHSTAFAPLLSPFCQLAAAAFQSGARAEFAPALSLAISVFPAQDPAAQRPLRQALDLINRSPAVQDLQSLGQADSSPDFAMVRGPVLCHGLRPAVLDLPVLPIWS